MIMGLVSVSTLLILPPSRLIHGHAIAMTSQHDLEPSLHNLPVEVFVEILLKSLTSDTRRPRQVFSFLTVCKYWHSIVLTDARFWTRIHTQYTRQEAQAFLLMSRNAPLKIAHESIRPPSGFEPMSLDEFKPYAYRIQSVAFFGWNHISLQPIIGHVLDLSITRPGGPSASWDATIPIHLGDQPSFRNLSLRNTFLSWDSLRISQLCTLSLSLIEGRAPTGAQFRRILESSPLLHSLRLYEVGPKDGGETIVRASKTLDTPPIHLSRLTELIFGMISPNLSRELLTMFSPGESCNATFTGVDTRLAVKMMGRAGRSLFEAADRVRLEIRHPDLERSARKPVIEYKTTKGRMTVVIALIPAKIRDEFITIFFQNLDEFGVRCPITFVVSSNVPRKVPLSTQISREALHCMHAVDEIQFRRDTNPGLLLRQLALSSALYDNAIRKACPNLKRVYVEHWREGYWVAFRDFLDQRWNATEAQPPELEGWDIPVEASSFEELKRNVNLHCHSRIRSNADSQNTERGQLLRSLFESL